MTTSPHEGKGHGNARIVRISTSEDDPIGSPTATLDLEDWKWRSSMRSRCAVTHSFLLVHTAHSGSPPQQKGSRQARPPAPSCEA
jgi:hypothetical protein